LNIYTLEDLKWDGFCRPKKSPRDNVTDKSIKRQSSIGGLFHFTPMNIEDGTTKGGFKSSMV